MKWPVDISVPGWLSQSPNAVFSPVLFPPRWEALPVFSPFSLSFSPKVRATLKGHAGDVLGLAFSPDGQTLASAGRDKMVRLWDPVTSQELLTLKGHQAPVHAVAFSPDGTILASGSHDGVIKLWRAPKM